MALIMKTGTIADSSIINTGLSSVKQFAIYRTTSMDSTGLLVGHYTENIGTHYTYCSSYSQYVKYITHGTTAPTINGGVVTWPGTIGENSHALASGVQYAWSAIGDE